MYELQMYGLGGQGAVQGAVVLVDALYRDGKYAQYLWLEQWDGKLPYVLGEGQNVILDVNALLDQGD